MLASCSGCGKTSMSLTWSMIQFPPASTPWRAPEFLFFMSEMHSTTLVSRPETRWNVGNHVESTRSVTPVNRIRPRSGKGKTPGRNAWAGEVGQGGGRCFSPGSGRGATHFTFLFSNPEPVVQNRSCESPHGPEKGFSAASRFRPEYAEGESLYLGNRRTTWFPNAMS